MTNSEPTSRRKFIGTLSTAAAAAATAGSLGAAVPRAVEAASVPAAAALPAGGCFLGADLVALAATEAASGKPVMTPSNINSALPPPTHQHFEPALRDFKTNPARFLQDRFTLTPTQVEGLRRLSPQDGQVVAAAVEESIKTKTPLRIVLSNVKRPKGATPFGLSKRSTPQGVDILVATDVYQ
jgi:hypothetical protein